MQLVSGDTAGCFRQKSTTAVLFTCVCTLFIVAFEACGAITAALWGNQ